MFVGSIPAVPSCHAEGKTQAKMMKNLEVYKKVALYLTIGYSILILVYFQELIGFLLGAPFLLLNGWQAMKSELAPLIIYGVILYVSWIITMILFAYSAILKIRDILKK